MLRTVPLVLVAVLLTLAAGAPASAQDAPPFPEYPDFRPGAVAAADQNLYSLALLDLFEAVAAVLAYVYRVERRAVGV